MLYKHLFYLLNKKVKAKSKTVKHFFAVSNRSNGWKLKNICEHVHQTLVNTELKEFFFHYKNIHKNPLSQPTTVPDNPALPYYLGWLHGM